STILDTLRAVVQPYAAQNVAERVALLANCEQLCERHKLDFPALLQRKSIEGHTTLYWAIANGPWPPRAPFELVTAVITYSGPLKPETRREARRVCLALRSEDMFQFLRHLPEFMALSSEDRLLLGSTVPPEEVVVSEMAGSAQPFGVRFKIPFFLKRMLLRRDIEVEFIARERLWQIKFFTAANPSQKWLRDGGWSGLLRLGENSPSTLIEFGLI
ncbi:hypothetical protein C8R46DRAFT_861018, partial [Mycena filopes]